ncbi:YkgJ family cysteine cluster protein [Candidatus Bathycorpusculum sp.]|uniref:YkgJ family cysteine cluster protein n=1 Tax=Candidatus Bathycorpusculum sp. TaxID=2994959 RepID=UPI0028184518|nr:YkgJ family cysteine cluster protein [Candidatus Termitimicrobium sp.]MCL2686267.1 YkgJ family cysteine cluster protein [Candidatus Termitimicrobium sp.]
MVATFYAHIKFKTQPSEWSVNLPFLCSKCGTCCTLDDFLVAGKLKPDPQNPQAHLKTQTLYEELGKRWETNPTQYDHYITHTPCPFLVNQTCSIYEIRPEGCRQFPNTPFGMQTHDCQALTRFKKQLCALKRGQTTQETYHFITQQTILPAQLAEKQYQTCTNKLQKTGITPDELALFVALNKPTK